MSSKDLDTRRRVLEVAARLFAERGFRKVTVREICAAADANVAAVNYHFRNKMGLYTEVARTAINAMRATTEAALKGNETATARDALHHYIRVHLHHILGEGHESWIHKLMTREMTDPTPALDLIVEEGIRPRLKHLARVISELMRCPVDDERVARCVASIRGQCLMYLPNPVTCRLNPRWRPTADQLDQIGTHIAEFSLAGIGAVARAEPTRRSGTRPRFRVADRVSRRNPGRAP